jgi:hypothetical protein
MFKIALDEFDLEKTVWDFLYDFREIVMYSLPINALASLSLCLLKCKDTLNKKDYLLYQICGNLIFESDPLSIEYVDDFLKLADIHDQLKKYRDELCICIIPEWRQRNSKESKIGYNYYRIKKVSDQVKILVHSNFLR